MNDFGKWQHSESLTHPCDWLGKHLANLNKVQATTPTRVNLIIGDGREKQLRFTRNVFKKRDDALVVSPLVEVSVYGC